MKHYRIHWTTTRVYFTDVVAEDSDEAWELYASGHMEPEVADEYINEGDDIFVEELS